MASPDLKKNSTEQLITDQKSLEVLSRTKNRSTTGLQVSLTGALFDAAIFSSNLETLKLTELPFGGFSVFFLTLAYLADRQIRNIERKYY